MITVEQLEPRLQASAIRLQENQRNLMAKADGQYPGFYEFFIDAVPQLLNEQIISHLMGVQAFSEPVGVLRTTNGLDDTPTDKAIEMQTRKLYVPFTTVEAKTKLYHTRIDQAIWSECISNIANEFLKYANFIVEYAHKCENIQSAIDHIFEQTGLRPNTIVCSSRHPIPEAHEGITIKEFDLDFEEIFVTYVSETTAGAWYCPYTPLMCAGPVKKQDADEPEMMLMTRYNISFTPEDVNKFYCII